MDKLLLYIARRWPMALIRALDRAYGRSQETATILIAGRWARIRVPGGRQQVVIVLPDGWEG